MSRSEGQKSLKSNTEDIYQNIINKLILEMTDEAQKEGYTDDLLKEIKFVRFYIINKFIELGK